MPNEVIQNFHVNLGRRIDIIACLRGNVADSATLSSFIECLSLHRCKKQPGNV